MTIVEFVNARLNEEERAAKAAGAGQWTADTEIRTVRDGAGVWVLGEDGDPVATARFAFDASGEGIDPRAIGGHIARHDPARVLREVAAKRAILREYTDAVDLWERESEAPDSVAALEAVTRHMAAAHSDHPDYDPAWAA